MKSSPCHLVTLSSGNSAGADGGGIHVESLTGFIGNSSINANHALGIANSTAGLPSGADRMENLCPSGQMAPALCLRV